MVVWNFQSAVRDLKVQLKPPSMQVCLELTYEDFFDSQMIILYAFIFKANWFLRFFLAMY
jgi:hypothetical protein